jgi:chromate transporter
MVVLGALYARFGDLAALQRVLAGLAAAAAGVLGARVIKMGQPLLREGFVPIAVATLAFLGIGVMRFSLPLTLIVLAPLSIALAAWARR